MSRFLMLALLALLLGGCVYYGAHPGYGYHDRYGFNYAGTPYGFHPGGPGGYAPPAD